MIFRRVTQLGLAVVLGMCAGCNAAGYPSADRVNQSVYREIRSVTVAPQAKVASGTDPQICSGFRLTDEQVRQFFAIATEVDVRADAADLEYGPCSVEGTLALTNGLAARWEIEMSGRGRAVFEDDHVMLLHCTRCSGPFAP